MNRHSTWRPVRGALLATLSPLAAFAPAAQAPLAADSPCFAEQAKLVAADGSPEAWFGTSVDVDAETLIVGASRDDEAGLDAGAAYVFVRDGASWTLQAKLLAAEGAAGDRFGQAVALRGDTALVGAQGAADLGPYTGCAYVFVRTGTSWAQEARLVSSDAAAGDLFGAAVALDGDTALVGAYADDDAGSFSGSAYVFARSGASWTQQAKLLPQDGDPENWFGYALSVSGDTALVGAPRDDDQGGNSGTAYVFTRSGATWAEEQKLSASDGGPLGFFGWSVALEADTALVGAYGGTDFGAFSGAAYVFLRAGASWSEEAELLPDVSATDDFFGHSVALSGDTVLVGTYGDDDAGLDSGSAFVFRRDGALWTQVARHLASDGAPGDFFGHAVALDGELALVAAIHDDDAGFDSGSVYVLGLPGPTGSAFCECPVGPCGNADPEAGCANSTGVGARLEAIGSTSPDEVTLLVEGARPDQFAIFFQGDDAVSIPFGDGLRCASGAILRITSPPIQTEADGTAGFGPCFGDASISSLTGVVPGSGVTRRYQFWYRDPGGPCAANFNLSNGYELTW